MDTPDDISRVTVVDGRLQSGTGIRKVIAMFRIKVKPGKHLSIHLEVKEQDGSLYRHLRYSKKKRKNRYGSKDRRGQIRNMITIDNRPEVVDKHSRIGDWDIDTVIGKNHRGVLVTIVERKSCYALMKILVKSWGRFLFC